MLEGLKNRPEIPKTGIPLAQVVAVEQGGNQRPFVSLDDLERLAASHPEKFPTMLSLLRRVYDETWANREGGESGVYVHKSHA